MWEPRRPVTRIAYLHRAFYCVFLFLCVCVCVCVAGLVGGRAGERERERDGWICFVMHFVCFALVKLFKAMQCELLQSI
jgi:hypothetical protein